MVGSAPAASVRRSKCCTIIRHSCMIFTYRCTTSQCVCCEYRQEVRNRWFRRWQGTSMDIRAQVERLWSGEVDLDTLQRGLHSDGARLIELILNAEDDIFDEPVAREYHNDEQLNDGTVSSAQVFFDTHVVVMRRIRQLADPEFALTVQPRFNQHGIEAERKEVRELNLPVWKSIGWNILKSIERLWAGERSLEVLCLGCDEGSRELVGMILSADGDDVGAAAEREHQAQHRAAAQHRAGGERNLGERNFFEQLVTHRRIRQLADPETAMSVHPHFCPGGVEAERQHVREEIIPKMAATGWNIGSNIEQLWAGERDLAVLAAGLDANETRLMTLILEADQPEYSAEAQAQRPTGEEGSPGVGVSQVGAQVKVLSSAADVERLQRGHGGWNASMQPYCGQTGVVSSVDGDLDCRVRFRDGHVWTYSPLALIAVGGFATGGHTSGAGQTSGVSPELRAKMQAMRQQARVTIMSAGFSASQATFAVCHLAGDGDVRFQQGVRDHTVSGESLAGGCIEYLIDHPEVGRSASRLEGGHIVCPSGHPIGVRAKTNQQRYCNECSASPTSHRCSGCEFDLCDACWVAAGGDAARRSVPVNCPGGHGLTGVRTPRPGFGCDVCGSSIAMGSLAHGCRTCNFDACDSCMVATAPLAAQGVDDQLYSADDNATSDEEEQEEEDPELAAALALSLVEMSQPATAPPHEAIPPMAVVAPALDAGDAEVARQAEMRARRLARFG